MTTYTKELTIIVRGTPNSGKTGLAERIQYLLDHDGFDSRHIEFETIMPLSPERVAIRLNTIREIAKVTIREESVRRDHD